MKAKIIFTILFLVAVSTVILLRFVGVRNSVPTAVAPPQLTLRPVGFDKLHGWDNVATKKSLMAFQTSCKAFLRQAPEKAVGSSFIHLKAKDWHPACRAAINLKSVSDSSSKQFFETWFTPFEFYDTTSVKGLFTGYFSPKLRASLTKTAAYPVPIFALPDNLVNVSLKLFNPDLRNRNLVGRVAGREVLPYFTRKEINHGAIDKLAKVIAWVPSHVDRLILEIEGSGVLELEDGTQLFLGYAGENGAPYTPIAKYLIEKGIMTKDNASMQRIQAYFASHSDQVEPIINQNKSFVFFRVLNQKAALGSQGVALTPGYSLAVDRKWIPMGTPIWLNTTRPKLVGNDNKRFHRLMIAQDTGGAIRGMVRGDVYWGDSKNATEIAGKMKNKGQYWLLLPRHLDYSGLKL